jgi:hypothetical protein
MSIKSKKRWILGTSEKVQDWVILSMNGCNYLPKGNSIYGIPNS